MKNFQRFLKNRYFFTFASSKNVSEVERPWNLVHLKGLTLVHMLHNVESFIRPLTDQEKSPQNDTFQAGGGKKWVSPPLYSKIGWLEDVRP